MKIGGRFKVKLEMEIVEREQVCVVYNISFSRFIRSCRLLHRQTFFSQVTGMMRRGTNIQKTTFPESLSYLAHFSESRDFNSLARTVKSWKSLSLSPFYFSEISCFHFPITIIARKKNLHTSIPFCSVIRRKMMKIHE